MEKEKESLGKIKQELETCQKQKQEYLLEWQRARADLLNYKKEESQRFEQAAEFIQKELVLRLLPVLDSFELAEKALNAKFQQEPEIAGLLQVKKQLVNLLKAQGLKEIKALGKEFNPYFCEAIETEEEETPGKETQGKEIIIEVKQKGYLFRGKLIRPAKVKTKKEKAPEGRRLGETNGEDQKERGKDERGGKNKD